MATHGDATIFDHAFVPGARYDGGTGQWLAYIKIMTEDAYPPQYVGVSSHATEEDALHAAASFAILQRDNFTHAAQSLIARIRDEATAAAHPVQPSTPDPKDQPVLPSVTESKPTILQRWYYWLQLPLLLWVAAVAIGAFSDMARLHVLLRAARSISDGGE